MNTVMDLFNVSGKTAVVVGGAGLLGRRFCRSLHDAYARVVLIDKELSQAQEYFDENGVKIKQIEADITSKESVDLAVKSVLDEFSRVDVLVNSAALDHKICSGAKSNWEDSDFESFPLDIWKSALEVNLTGMFLTCQAVCGIMKAQGAGSIINLCSIYGLVGPDQRVYLDSEGKQRVFKPAFYSVSKAGVLGLTKYLAAYLAGTGVRVNALTPGGIFDKQDVIFCEKYSSKTILGRLGGVDELNGALIFLASDASSYMTGSNLVVDGGWTAW